MLRRDQGARFPKGNGTIVPWMRALTLEAELAARPRRGRVGAANGPSMTNVDAWRAGLAVLLTTLYTEEDGRTRDPAAFDPGDIARREDKRTTAAR